MNSKKPTRKPAGKNAGSTVNNASLVSRTFRYINANRLIKRGDRLLLGVSGGADSVALLLILHQLRHQLGIDLAVAHFNHNLRQGSGRDEQFVKKLCQSFNVPLVVSKPASVRKHLSNIEEWGRALRLAFFTSTTRRLNCNKIVLAHHLNDQAETVLMRLLRGTGLQGVRAMQPMTYLKQLWIIRPLLAVERTEIEEFLSSIGQEFCIDPTNFKTDFLRNKIRHQLIPLLREDFNPNICSVLANLAETVADDYHFLEATAEQLLKSIGQSSKNSVKLDLVQLRRQHSSMVRLILRKSVETFKGDTRQLTLKHVHEVMDLIEHHPDGSSVHLPANICFQKSGTTLKIKKDK